MVASLTGTVKDWHSPRNEECAHNGNIDADCSCKRPARQRKPYRVCRVHDDNVPHGCRAEIVLEVHPNGRLIFREAGRRKSNAFATSVGEIYSRLTLQHARQVALAKKAARKARRK